MNTTNGNARDAAVARIARELLHIETLEERRSDSLDFHDVGVGSLRDALEAAYQAGRASRDPEHDARDAVSKHE